MKKINLGVLTFILSDSGSIPLSHLIELMIPTANNLVLLTGGAGYESFKTDKRLNVFEIKNKNRNNFIGRVFEYFLTQIKISYKMLKIKDLDTWIFFIGGDTLILPMLTAKLFRKKVFLFFAGSSIKTLESSGDNFYKIARILSKINCKLSNKIILYSNRHISEWELEEYKEKIFIASHHFINFDKFKVTKELCKRDNLIGYIGRLSKEKGIEQFLHSIPELIKINPNIKFLICGDGILKDEIGIYIKKNNLDKNVMLIPWISHEEVPAYLNKLKLLVLPSFTEGLPNIILEAMACGTPVLATGTGAILDIIENKKTGFILKNNSRMCITEGVMDFINCKNKEEITYNSLENVRNRFTYEKVLDNWKTFLEE